MNTLTHAAQWLQGNPVVVASVAALTVTAAVLAARISKALKSTERRKLSAGTVMAIVAFIVCTSVSLHTSYAFTADGLDMTGTFERVFACAAFESLMAMSVFGARERLADPENPSPGWYGAAVWVFAGLSSVPAWHEGHGLTASTLVRIIAGSFGSALAAHAALGLELRHRAGEESQAASAQIAREFRERLMARLGLAQRGQTAQEIARDRALDRAVDLADREERLTDKQRKNWRGRRVAVRLGRALEVAETTDPARRQLFKDRLALRRHASLRNVELAHPWEAADPSELAALTARAEQAEAAVALLESQVRAVEELAESAEAAAAAGVIATAYAQSSPVPHQRSEQPDADDEAEAGSIFKKTTKAPATSGNAEKPAAAGAPTGSPRVQVRIPLTTEAEADTEEDEDREVLDLAGYTSKKAAVQALYRRDIAADDPRTTNAIAEELREKYKAETGQTFDQAAAHRAVAEIREPKPHPADQQDDDQQPDEQASA